MGNFKKFLISPLGRITVTLVTAVIILGTLVLLSYVDLFPLALAICIFLGYFGWKFLFFLPFQSANSGVVIISFVLKLILAVTIGFIVAPFQIGKMVSRKVNNSIKGQ